MITVEDTRQLLIGQYCAVLDRMKDAVSHHTFPNRTDGGYGEGSTLDKIRCDERYLAERIAEFNFSVMEAKKALRK